MTRRIRMLGIWPALSLALLALTFPAPVLPTSQDGSNAHWDCNPTTGLDAPLPVCSASSPCVRPAAELGVTVITTSSEEPLCRTTENGRPFFDDGSPLRWTDPTGVTRYACLFRPRGASPASPRPLVVWLHGGGLGTATSMYNDTSIRAKAESTNLTGDPSRRGFFLLAVQGRNLHYPTHNPRDGRHHDFYFRDLGSPSRNPDIANLDRLIDELVAEGSVDVRRIYLMGWSNGGFFGQMYAIARHRRATPGGQRVAAAAIFTAADPFHNINEEQVPSCQLDPYPRSTVPIFLAGRACDVIPCDQAQDDGLRNQGFLTEPGFVVSTWIGDLATKVGDPQISRLIIAGNGSTVTACTSPRFCTPLLAFINHVRWPDGVADRSGIDHEPEMLDFLRAHPLP